VHRTVLEVSSLPPPQVEAGRPFGIKLAVVCAEGCDLSGETVTVMASGETLASAPLLGTNPSETDEVRLAAPGSVGVTTWQAIFHGAGSDEVSHDPSAASFSTTVTPHATSIAVWGVPSPIVGSAFTVRAGVKCSANCRLGGQFVEVRDGNGERLAIGRLSDEPRHGTSALHPTEITLSAPQESGVFSRSVRFLPTDLDLPHEPAAADFTFRAIEPPRHTVTVQVVPKGTEASMAGIDVRVGPYRATTDAKGEARVGAAEGSHELSVWRIDLEPVSRRADVNADLRVEVEVEPRRVVDEDAERAWM
jgi:hypothetical protein